jgi:CheY-like chemotaxis protein
MARILLADDDKGALDLVKRALETDGHTVTTFEDGNEALSALQSARFDVLVADIEMPGLDGIALATSARAQMPGLGVIFISGSNELLDKARAHGPAGARLVTKPFPIDLIRTQVRAALGS